MATQRILLIRPSALGDVARTAPVAASLRRGFPDAEIHWLVRKGFEDAVRGHPAVDRVITFPRKELGRALRGGRMGELLRFARELRQPGYDIAIDAQGLLRSALITRLTGAPVRVGPSDAREGARLFYTLRVRSRRTHTVDRMLDLVRAMGVEARPDMRLYRVGRFSEPTSGSVKRKDVGSENRHTQSQAGSESRGTQSQVGSESRRTRGIVIAPTSRWEAKRWPVDRFDALVARLLAKKPGPVVLVGGPDERDQCGPLLERARWDPRVIDRVGDTGVGDLMDLIADARLVVANDSAAAHIAVGFDRPLVALYGPTDVSKVGPYGRIEDVIQDVRLGDTLNHKDPKNRVMMERITTEVVERACLARLVG